jgi:hypothetical protein
MTRPFSVLASYFLLVPGFPGVSLAPTLRTLRCNNGGATDRYLQCFSGTAIPADTSVPLFAPLLLPNGYISEDTFPDGRQVASPGLVLVVSSTRATLTKDVAATVDITAEIDEFEQQPAGVSVAGDYTTAVKKLQVWADASGPKTLIKVEAANTSASTAYLQLFAYGAPINGQVPEYEWTMLAGAYLSLSFGNNAGLVPRRNTAAGTTYLHEGCELVFSSTSWSRTIVAANAGTLRATYR